MSGPVLLIGGAGFVGSHLADRLAAAGRPARVTSRQGRWPWGAPPAGVEMAPLDLTGADRDARLDALLADASGVVNLAGALLRPGRPAAAYRALHRDGAAAVAAAARRRAERGAPLRLVHVSTTGVLGPTGTEPLDETAPPRPRTLYEITKLEGEEEARAARGGGLEVVTARPGLVYGPRDLHLLALFRSIASGTFRCIGGGRALWQPIFAPDVARGLAAALDAPGADGLVVHLAGAETVSVAGLAERIAALLGTRVRRPGLPRPLALAAGAVLAAACAPLGLTPPLTPARVRTLTEHRRYATGLAARRLGFAPEVGLEEGLAATVAWYRERGHLD